jgi:ubiquinone/menaquinone biosynthesis C-methylase UbiE
MNPTVKFSNAEAYEHYMGRWSRLFARRFVDFVGITDGERVLDVGCGTGSLTYTLASSAPRSEIVGIDPSTAFVDYARSRTSDPRLSFDVGNAQSLPYPDGSFDKCLSLLVFQFIPDVPRAIGEIRRVTRVGGTVAACVWDKDVMEMHSVFWDSAAELEPGVDQRRGTPYASGQLSSLWKQNGLKNIDETGLEMQLEFASFDDYWTPVLGGQGPAGSYLLGLAPDRQLALRQHVRGKVLGTDTDRPFRLRAKAWAVRGVK